MSGKYNIKIYYHPELPLVGFKYGLTFLDELKFHDFVRECRGLVLEKETWNIVAEPFHRFFNLGEDKDCEAVFDWTNFVCDCKEDGSIIIVYYYDGKFRVNTSGSFGQGLCGESGLTWEELFWKTSGISPNTLIRECTYMFELCTKYNKIVRIYEESAVYLLGFRNNISGREYPAAYVDLEANAIGVKRPKRYEIFSQNDLYNCLAAEVSKDPTFEGFVLTDRNFNRIKFKSDDYKQLHWIKGNNHFSIEKVINQILSGNLQYLQDNIPEWHDEIFELMEELEYIKNNSENLLWEGKYKNTRREFAEHIMRYAAIPTYCFMIYDKKYATIEDALRSKPEPLIKYLEKKWKTMS